MSTSEQLDRIQVGEGSRRGFLYLWPAARGTKSSNSADRTCQRNAKQACNSMLIRLAKVSWLGSGQGSDDTGKFNLFDEAQCSDHGAKATFTENLQRCWFCA